MPESLPSARQVVREILTWHQTVDRQMPWKRTKDAYSIWVSEVILQQTQVAQGRAYYTKFIEQFPTVVHLAKAEESVVLKAWEGLGYYRRAINMHVAAKQVLVNHKGQFPNQYEQIRALKGIGEYTAAAIGSFAYNMPYIAIDSNVERYMARLFGLTSPKTSPQLKKSISHALQPEMENTESPADLNQALIDFGALICRPRNPVCTSCPLHIQCYALKNNLVDQLPITKLKPKRKERYFHYVIQTYTQGRNKFVRIEQRLTNDIWAKMYQFALIESNNSRKLPREQLNIYLCGGSEIENISKVYKQTLTHQEIQARFYVIKHESEPNNFEEYIQLDQFEKFTFPGVIRLFVKENLSIFNQ